MDLNTFILLCILIVVLGIGSIHVYKLKKQCTAKKDTEYELTRQQIALNDGKIIDLEIRVKVLEDQ